MTFSVALCTYNGAAYIQEQLDSILRQTVPVSEIIICDDNSQDGTVAIAEKILRERDLCYQILVNDPPLGVAGNFLKALKHTTGEYVFTCDQDDIWHEDKVEIFRDGVRQSGKALFFSDGALVDGDGKPLGSTLWEAYGVDRELASGQALLPILIRRPMVTGAAMLVSRELIDQINGIPEQWLHDEWFAMAAAAKDDIAPVYAKTFDYRQHGRNVIGAKKYSFAEKAKMWVSNISKQVAFRKVRLKKTTDVLMLTTTTKYDETTKEAVAFWETLNGLSSYGLGRRLVKIYNLYRCGGYGRFYNGLRGAVRDCLSCFLRQGR